MAKRPSSGTKNRQRNEVFEMINHDAAGIDAHSEFHWVALPMGRAEVTVRKFATTTIGLYALVDWLVENSVTTVAVEATGVYCVPLLEVLDARGLKVVLAKPTSLKWVNDRRKTDMLDCQWIQTLHMFGLLRASYRPTQLVATFRVYTRQRRMLIESASTAIEHMKKALIQMNVRLDKAVSDVTGVTGMTIIRAIVAGERDPAKLAALRDERCKKNQAEIEQALFGKYADEHLFELAQAVRTFDHYQGLIAECSEKLEHQGRMFDKKASLTTLPPVRRREQVRKNILPFEAREQFYEILGQDLTQISGIGVGTVSTFIAEVGTTVDAFATRKHFTSWLRLSPGSNSSGGKNRSGRNHKTSNRLATALRVAAQALERSNTALGAFYRRMKRRHGPEKAINAAANKLACMIYDTLKLQRPYVDPGPDYYTFRNEQKILKNMQKNAQRLGYKLVKAA